MGDTPLDPNGDAPSEPTQPEATVADPASPAHDAPPEEQGAVSDDAAEEQRLRHLLFCDAQGVAVHELSEEDLGRYVEEALAELGAFPKGDEELSEVFARQIEAVSLGDTSSLIAWLRARPGARNTRWSRSKIPGVKPLISSWEPSVADRTEVAAAWETHLSATSGVMGVADYLQMGARPPPRRRAKERSQGERSQEDTGGGGLGLTRSDSKDSNRSSRAAKFSMPDYLSSLSQHGSASVSRTPSSTMGASSQRGDVLADPGKGSHVIGASPGKSPAQPGKDKTHAPTPPPSSTLPLSLSMSIPGGVTGAGDGAGSGGDSSLLSPAAPSGGGAKGLRKRASYQMVRPRKDIDVSSPALKSPQRSPTRFVMVDADDFANLVISESSGNL
ncbi:hypothetical protein T484DRAFT_1971018 [Baffinella frigidus]|nr:hypothetical protein T484DRAFT_1971018 [Cryptophyta sp. CCMP2293]